MEPRHLIRAAIAFSVIGHLALVVGVFFADARPFEPPEADTFAVDVVTPEQVAAAEQAAEPAPKPEPPKPEFRLPEPDKPTLDDSKVQPEAQKLPPAQQQAAQPAAAEPPPAAQALPASPPPTPSPPPQQQAAVPPPPQPAPASSPPVAEPDITVKYGVQLGLPEASGGEVVTEKADIEPLAIDAFRRHLKSCSRLPAGVSRNDDIRILVRVILTPGAMLAAPPAMIGGNPRGPVLSPAAIQALQACQPYTMLPADRYQEWKVLDLTFTPQDFAG